DRAPVALALRRYPVVARRRPLPARAAVVVRRAADVGAAAESARGLVRCARLADGLSVVEVPLPLAEQEQILVGPRRPVPHRLRHRVGLAPDDVHPKRPLRRLEGEGDAPGDAEEVLRAQAGWAHFHRPRRVLRIRCARLPSTGGVAVPQVQPEGPVIAQHPVNLGEHLHQVLDEQLRRRLQAQRPAPRAAGAAGAAGDGTERGVFVTLTRDAGVLGVRLVGGPEPVRAVRPAVLAGPIAAPHLRWEAVVPEPVVRRGRDHAVDALSGHRPEDVQHVALAHLPRGHHATDLASSEMFARTSASATSGHTLLPISLTCCSFVRAAERSYEGANRPNCARSSSCGSSIRIPMSMIWYSVPSTVTRPRRCLAVTVRSGSSTSWPPVPSSP